MSNQPSRSQQRQSRRAERRAQEERRARRQRLLLAGGVVALALIVGLALILLPRLSGGSSAGTSDIQVAEGAPTGVPTSDRTMGDPNAPVTVTEWGDYQ